MKTKFEVFKEAVADCLKNSSINVTEIRCLWHDADEEIEKIKRMQFLNCFGEGFLEFATDIDLERIVLEIHYEYNPFDNNASFVGLDWDIPVNLTEVGFPGIAKTLTETSRIGYPKYILRRATELNRPGIVTNYLDALEESERVKVLDRYLDVTMTSDNYEMTMMLMRYKHEHGMMTDIGIGRL